MHLQFDEKKSLTLYLLFSDYLQQFVSTMERIFSRVRVPLCEKAGFPRQGSGKDLHQV